MRALATQLRFFLAWAVAFYATALAFVFEARRQGLPTVLALAVVGVALTYCARTAMEPETAS